jgi:hypothetical protein
MADPLGRTKPIQQVVTSTAGTYVTGQAFGGKITFPNVAFNPSPTQNNGGGGVIYNVGLSSSEKHAMPFDLVLFSTDFTPTADRVAFNPSNADLLNCIGYIPITASDYPTAFANNEIALVQRPLAFRSQGGSICGQLVARGSAVYSAGSVVAITAAILQD